MKMTFPEIKPDKAILFLVAPDLLDCCKKLRNRLIGKRTIAGQICLVCGAFTDDSRKALKHRKNCIVIRADKIIAKAEGRT